MKKFILSILLFPATALHAQQYSVQAGNAVGLYYNNNFDFDISSGFTLDATYTSVIKKFGVLYNLGAEYSITGWGSQVLIQTGYSKVWMRPTGFIRAADKESVTYIKSNWMISTDLNIYNGFALTKPNPLYVFAVEPAFVASYKTGSHFFITGTIAPRFTWSPAYKEYGEINSYTDIVFKLGVSWFINRQKFRP